MDELSPTKFSPGLKTGLAALAVLALGAWGIDRAFQAGISYQNLRHWHNPVETENSVTVTGEGTVTAIPDIGVVQLSVQSEARTVREVQTDNTQKMSEIIAYLKGMDITKEDIKTTQYSLYPNYSYNPQNGKQNLDGYRLTQTVEVKVRNLDKIGDALAGALDRGANQVGNITFTIDNPDKFLAEAREKAFKEAREKAKLMAKAAGVRLGEVKTFSENVNNPGPGPVYYARDMAMLESKAPAPQLEAGSQELMVNVSITFELD